jgi:hypothetical protein
MLLPFYAEEASPEVVHIPEDPGVPLIQKVVEESQKGAYIGRRIMGILLPVAHRPTVTTPYSWR